MLNDGDFRKGLDKLMNHPDSCSKEELYVGFLEMTERYLNEMITTMNFENAIIEELGEKRGEVNTAVS